MKPYQEHDEQNYTENKSNKNCGCNPYMRNGHHHANTSFKKNEEWNDPHSLQRHKENEKEWSRQSEGSYYNCNQIRSQSPVLPDVSKRFQAIMINALSPSCLTELNLPLGETVPFPPRECRQIITEYQTLIGSLESGTDIYFYIFYHTDDGGYVIANRENGRVLEYMDNPSELFRVLRSRLYNGSSPQIFNIFGNAHTTFRLQTQTQPSGESYVLRPCNDDPHSLISLLFTRTSLGLSNPNTLLNLRESERIPPVPIPSLQPPSKLGPIPELTHLGDYGNPPAPALVGTALLPCIFVNDRTMSQRIKDSPYYILECYDYWKLISSHEVQPYETKGWEENTGMNRSAQDDMRDMINITIGNDKRLRFFNLSSPFRQSIVNNINISASNETTDLPARYEPNSFTNNTSLPIRYAKYFIARQFLLKRSNQTTPIRSWEYVDNTISVMKQFTSPS
ncbi:hypothetical protein SPE26_32745 [Bacillus thuringiensis]|uniref:Uncharacterized protein n=1 Tax=Bacillus thuringiensis TaxID=1428 RepID=A0AAW9GSH1_BACTU|nr:hypothetical protein [Bacillus thuringiensis]MDY0855561.1 hypothetical protein [Bacillus thuringiensis]MDY4395374.1 hypothetical protein [Bacillus thuringiensis]